MHVTFYAPSLLTVSTESGRGRADELPQDHHPPMPKLSVIEFTHAEGRDATRAQGPGSEYGH